MKTILNALTLALFIALSVGLSFLLTKNEITKAKAEWRQNTAIPTPVLSPSITTGVEGILTVGLHPLPAPRQNVYAGESMASLIGIELQAELSPISIQRVQVDIGSSTLFYTSYFKTLYLVDEKGFVLAQADLNSSTVTERKGASDGSEYYVTFSGFNSIVPGDNSMHVLTIKGDLYDAIDWNYSGAAIAVMVDPNGVRGKDGAGIQQYGPSAGVISNTVVLETTR